MKIVLEIIKDFIHGVRGWDWTAIIAWSIMFYIAYRLFKFMLALFT
jgi:hypothetical protein